MPHQHAMTMFVDRLAIRSQISGVERAALLALGGLIEKVPARRDIVASAQGDHAACLIIEGLVGRFGQARDGSRQISALYIEGDMPDLHSVMVPRASAALVALTSATLLRVPHAAFAALLEAHPRAAEIFWRECVIDADIAHAWVINLGHRGARSRIAHLYCEMATAMPRSVATRAWLSLSGSSRPISPRRQG